MRRLCCCLAALALTGLFCAAAGGAETDPAPYVAIRALESLQDRIATGDTIAQAAHAKAIGRTARAFARMSPATWADARNARALVTYLFSGGDAAVIARSVPRGAIANAYAALYDGALAYGLGDDEKARTILLPIDAKTLPSGLAGHLALVQGTLIEPTDKARAIALLDLARLLDPGTLIEEASLRKEMLIEGADGDLDKLMLLTHRYEAAFGQSVYSENFRQMVAELAALIGAANTDGANAKLARLLDALSKDARRRIYLSVARRETIAGHLVVARFAAEQGGRLCEPGSRDEARAVVYRGASTIVGSRYETAIRALSDTDPGKLDANDQVLRRSALSIAAMIRRTAAPRDAAGKGAADAAILADGEHSLVSAAVLLGTVKP